MESLDRLNAIYPDDQAERTVVADHNAMAKDKTLKDSGSRENSIGDTNENDSHAGNCQGESICPMDCENTLPNICEADGRTPRCSVCRQCLCTAHCAGQSIEYEQGCVRTTLCSGYTEVAGFRYIIRKAVSGVKGIRSLKHLCTLPLNDDFT